MKLRKLLLPILLLAVIALPLQYSLASTNPVAGETVFDFAANAAYAQWKSGAGPLPFPGTSGDLRGYTLPINSPTLEDGTVSGNPGLLVVPQNKYDGYIQGIYPEFTVQKNDHFQASVGCDYGATGCYVTFRLDYINTAGVTKIFWQWKEKNEGRYYNVDLNLSALAGQKVRFVLTLLATGYASGDRALWAAPRIVRPGDGKTPLPTLTPTNTPFSTPPPVTPADCDRATFVADLTVPDGTSFAPGAAFTKSWRLKNTGACTWSTDYTLVFYSGEQMGAPTAVNLPQSVAPSQTVDVSINAVAPATAGAYKSYWILRNPSGALFGIGSSSDKPFWMQINVTGTAPVNDTGYDFVSNACAAQWQSGVGNLPCPGEASDTRGSSRAVTAPRMEDALVGTSGLVTIPQNKYDGYVKGIYPTFTVQPGDRFQAVVGCEYGWSCYVTFRLDYLAPDGTPRIYWQWMEKNEGRTHLVNLDLTPLAGQSLRFVLTTLATGPATNDHALWASPRIVRPGLQPPSPTPTPNGGPGTIVSSPALGGLSMMDASNGWAIGDNCVLHTMNGGATWRNVLPGVAVSSSYFQNSTNAWVIQNPSTLYRTTNGGYSWTQYAVPFNADHLQSHLQFLNSNNGFLMAGGPIGMFKFPIALYQTTDGGAHWTLKFTHGPPATDDGLDLSGYKNGMTFRDTQNGWIGGGNYPGSGYFILFRTTDGGVTWARVQPALPAGYEAAYIDTTAPKFFSATDGILPVWLGVMDTGMRDLFLYVTHDGGNTWTPSAGYIRSAATITSAVDFISINNAFGWDYSGNFYSTSNAGGSWTTVTPNINFGEGYRALDFISPSTGWLILSSVNGSTPLYRTTDGGHTWTLISGPPAPAPATSTATPTVTPTITLTPTATPPPVTAAWPVFANPVYGFQLKYPPDGYVSSQSDTAAHINLPIVVTGTNLDTKFMEVKVNDGVDACSTTGMFSPLPDVPNENVVINGFNFTKSQGSDGAMGRATRYIAYSTLKGRTCVTLLFALRYAKPEFYPTPPWPLFDLALESAIFDQIMSTFAWPDLPSGTVMAVNLASDVGLNSCSPGPVHMDLAGDIAVNGPATVVYHWEIMGDSVQGVTQDQSLVFTGAAIQTVTTAFDLPCGSHAILLRVTSPTVMSGQVNVPLYPSTPTPTATPIVTDTPTPTLTATPSPTAPQPTPGFTSPFAVLGVPPASTLKIYSNYGANNPVIGEFPADAKAIERGMYSNLADGIHWVYVYSPERRIGWVDDQYLTEYVTPGTFSADTRAAALIDSLKQALNNADGNLLASLVSPKRGVRISYHGLYGPGIVFMPDQARNLFASTDSITWGAEGASGNMAVGTFTDIVKPKLLNTLNANYELHPNEVQNARMYPMPWPDAYQNVNYFSVFKPGGTGSAFFDWREWLVGIEYVNGQPYIFSLLQYVWEP